MAIQPIDLQTLFTQLDKVGKTQANQREGLQLQQALLNTQIQKKTEERIQSVNETQDMGEGVERIKDKNRNSRRHAGEDASSPGNRKGQNRDAEETEDQLFKDPLVGKNIDLSG